MDTLQRSHGRNELTLERALLLALLVHAAGLLLVDQWRDVLIPPIAPAESRPIEFRLVDTPDAEPVPPPETEVHSDRDRRAADASPRDDASDPFSRGDTRQAVLRSPEEAVPAVESPPVRPLPPAEAEAAEAAPEEVAERGETPTEAAERPAEGETTEAAGATTTAAPAVLPSRPRDFRRQLTRLESFVDAQTYDNPDGGAQDSGSLAQFDTRGYDLGPYLRQVLRKIEGNWRSNIPPLIRTGVGGATFVNLSIRRERRPDGSEVAVIVAERTWSSGQPAYDSAALFSLEISSPLPAIPDHYPHEEITGRLGFIYNMDPGTVVFPEGR